MIKSLDDYKEELEEFSSYGNVIGVDEFEEYAISLFVLDDPDTGETVYYMYIGYENGLGSCHYADLLIYSSEDEKES